jgi:hypothetical protein
MTDTTRAPARDAADQAERVRGEIRALRALACDGDLIAYAELNTIQREIEDDLLAATTALRGELWGYSLRQLAAVLGVTGSAVYKRFRTTGARSPGGQPLKWR